MSRIIEIRKLSGGRYLVCLEDERRFPLYGKELSGLSWQEGEDVPEEKLSQIYQEILTKRARERAMHLLEQMDRTEQQLREKLEQAQYPAEVIDDAVAYVKSFHYIDDLRYARNYLESHAASKSLRQMKQALEQKGIAKEDLEQAVLELSSEGDLPDEEEQIKNLLAKKKFDPDTEDRSEQQRIYAYLARRGYSLSAIRHVMQEKI